ncbi:MAG: hypothetical protein RBT34_03905 [Anaerolineaceae bacterium]|jgi:hypothetical protein|nr:hypothetical protein [Anaerolineaceae bacterium]
MSIPKKSSIWYTLFIPIVLAISMAACSPAPAAAMEVEVTRIVQETVVITEIVKVVVTATPEPAPPDPTPTATPEVLTLAADGFNAWCLPRNTSSLVERINVDGSMPETAKAYAIVEGVPEITTQVSSCTFAFSFNAPVNEAAALRFLDNNGFAFQTSPLTTLEAAPNMAYSAETHEYIVNPPFWQITYDLQVVNASGEVLWTSPVSFRRGWVPRKCFYGEWPDPVTCRCPNLPESHPENAWWGWFPPYPDGCPY